MSFPDKDCPGCYRPRPTSKDRPLDGSMHFMITKHSKEAFEMMNGMRHAKKLCDVRLTAGAETFEAHRLVLAAASPYFKAMFCCGMREGDMSDIPMQGISPMILGTLINFAYTSEINISEMNVCSLLPAACMFQMNYVIEACCTFLEQQLDPSNCIGIADFAQAHGCLDLYQKAKSFIYENFGKVALNEEFLQWSPSQLMQVIKRDDVFVRCESEVYRAVIRWVAYDPGKRQGKLEQLLGAVRCHYLTPKFIKEELSHCELLRRAPKCHEYLDRIYQDLVSHKRFKEKRRNRSATLVIYTIGGYLRHSLGNVECYKPPGQWTRLANLPMPRSGVACCVVHDIIYVIGGRNNSPEGNIDSNSVDCFNPFRNVWSKCQRMSVARNRVGVGTLDGFIYAVGGSDSTVHHNSVERYDPETDTWSSVTPMDKARIGVGVATVNRLLFAIGGYDGQSRLRSVELYHPEKDKWISVASMKVTRSGAGVAAVDQFIYAVGGYDGYNQLDSVERYDTERDQWDIISPMNRPRSALSVAVLNNKIYALGGYDGNEFLSSVEVYDPDREEWKEDTNMSGGRSGHGTAVTIEPCLK